MRSQYKFFFRFFITKQFVILKYMHFKNLNLGKTKILLIKYRFMKKKDPSLNLKC